MTFSLLTIKNRAASTRIVCGLWWFFTLIVIQSYIANLAAVLTKDRIETTIESAEDLEQQTAIKYGAMLGGSTLGFFRESNYSTYHRMWSTMEANADAVLVRSNGEGVERVARGAGSYAFLMESSSIEHIINRNCNLTQVGSQLDSKGYGIALPMSKSKMLNMFELLNTFSNLYFIRFSVSHPRQPSFAQAAGGGQVIRAEDPLVE